jgi:hypothetical protein
MSNMMTQSKGLVDGYIITCTLPDDGTFGMPVRLITVVVGDAGDAGDAEGDDIVRDDGVGGASLARSCSSGSVDTHSPNRFAYASPNGDKPESPPILPKTLNSLSP